MISKKNMKDFVHDLKLWGRFRVKRVISMTNRYGVLCNSTIFSDGNAG